MTPAELKEARRTLGLTQTDLAAVLGLSKRQIITIEGGGEKPVRAAYAALVRSMLADKEKAPGA